MSVDILQGPTTPNVTKTNLVYTLSSSNASNPQFRYVTDIYESGSGDYVTTIKTYPNLSGNSILDLSRTLDDQLDYDQYWKVTGSIQPIDSVKTFNIIFGEEYAPSYSGSITLYTGSSAYNLEVFPGEVYKNEGSYNFNTSSFIGISNPNAYLTNCPSAQNADFGYPEPDQEPYLLNSTDYFTVTSLIENVADSGSIRVRGVKLENGVSTLVREITITASDGLGEFTTWGIGPQNLSDYNSTWATDIANGDINGITTFNDPGAIVIYINNTWDGIPITSGTQNFTSGLDPRKQCSDEYTRFAFINQYGFWDYYNVYNPLRSNNQVDRSIYERSFVRYEDSIGSYNISNRGNTQYRTEYDKRYITTTDYLTKETSQWLTELFESPEVYVQQNGNFVPINITNTNVRNNMNTSRNKLFQYDIEFKYANQPQPR